jgi:hypothetical protein
MGTYVLGALIIVASLVAGYLWLPAIGDPSPEALQHSLTRAAGGKVSGSLPGCDERGRNGWSCDVSDSHGSGRETYRLRMTDTRCWRARKVSPNPAKEGARDLPRRTTGCVMWRDQLRLASRL